MVVGTDRAGTAGVQRCQDRFNKVVGDQDLYFHPLHAG